MKQTTTAYEGKQPYIFISYAHKDSACVLPVIESLAQNGFRVWYDAGIEAGTEWPEYIAEHLAGASCVIAFLSAASIASKNCRQEITFALARDRAMLTVFLEDVKLPLGLEMQLGLTQAMFYHRHATAEGFIRELEKAELLQVCREPKAAEPPQASAPAPKAAPKAEPKPAPKKSAAATPLNLSNDEMTVVDGVLERYHAQKEAVVIPEGVTVIGGELFKGNATLKSIRLPKSLTMIRAWAFAECPNLEEITIPGGVEVVSSNLFVGSGLRRVHLSEGVSIIGNATFKDCASLAYVGLPKTLKDIGTEAFKGCKSLKRVQLPEGVSYVKEGKRSFPASVKLTDGSDPAPAAKPAEKPAAKPAPVYVPQPAPVPRPKHQFDIIGGVLKCYRGVGGNLEIPGGVTEIGRYAFLDNHKLTGATLPFGVCKIDVGAFEGCEKLESISIPASVRTVESRAFAGCAGLQEIKISKKAPCLRALKKMLPKTVKLIKV